MPIAPTGGYAGSAELARDPAEFRPKGKNLKEVSDLEGRHVDPEIGTENDPGRVAEQDLLKRDARSGADAANPTDTSKQKGDHPYSALGEEAA